MRFFMYSHMHCKENIGSQCVRICISHIWIRAVLQLVQLWPWVEHLSAESFHSWKICCNYFISFLLVWFLIFKILLVHRTVKLNFPIETPFEKWIALNSGFVYNIPDHKNLFLEFPKKQGSFMLHLDRLLIFIFR